MYKGKTIAVVVPAFNEENAIAGVLVRVPQFVDSIIVVDDASKDFTGEIVSHWRDPRVKLIRNRANQGVGGSILNGHRSSTADIDVVMAGDGQMNPRYLPRLLDAVIDGADYSKGNRFGDMKTMPAVRIFGNFALSLMTKVASGYWHISDPQNGYTALDMKTFRLLESDHIEKRWQFENDMLVHLAAIKAKVVDVPMPSEYHGEKSRLKTTRFVVSTMVLLGLRFFWRRKASARYGRTGMH